jgi:hypothetical protein
MLNRNALASLCLLGLSALGCTKETTSSTNIKTPGIVALIDVYADTETTATVHVDLRVGGSKSDVAVTLDNGDKLTATAAGKTKALTATHAGIYEAEFSGVEGGTEFQVTLDRPDDQTSTDNTGTLPDPFALDDPTPDLSRMTDDLEVTWAPAKSGDPMHLTFDGDCIFPYDHAASDTGSYVVDKGTLDSTGGDKPKTCDITVDVERTRAGSADSLFDADSWFKLHQRRSASFTSAP